MSRTDVDEYLSAVHEPARATLEQVRAAILEVLPDAEEGIAYGCPAFKLNGIAVAGFAAYKNHLSYLPHSGSVIAALDPGDVSGYETSKGALKFPLDEPPPPSLVAKLIEARMRELEAT